ncbi:diguanylate cyclase [Rheinheimera sp.]|uniref:diguanylate cyclase domain-containing protein n=1 Tax=Rheinheimera sp. TaxID=1869214 RepID=UPI00307F4C08
MTLLDHFNKSRLKVKLLLLAGLPLLIVLLALLLILSHLYQANARISTLYSDRVVPLQQLKTVSDAYAIDLVDSTNKRLSSLISSEQALQLLMETQYNASQAWQQYLQTELVGAERTLIDTIEPKLARVNALHQQITMAIARDDLITLQHIARDRLYPGIDSLNLDLKQLSAIQLTEAQRIYTDSQRNLRLAYGIAVLVLLAMLFCVAGLIRTLSKLTLQSVQNATQSATALFSTPFPTQDPLTDEHHEVRSYLLDTIEQIRKQLGFGIEETMRLLSAIPAPVLAIWDEKGRVSSVNYAFERLFGLSRENIVGQHIESTPIWPENASSTAIKTHLAAARQGSSATFHTQLELRQGHSGSRLFLATVSSWRQRNNPVTLLAFEDVTAWHKREQSLSNKVARDPLTGLLNRDGFHQMADDLWFRWKAYDAPFALVMVDINNFKPINDNYGHQTGDAVLKEFADRLQHSCRNSDISVRWGGDEFIVLLVGCPNAEVAIRQVQRITAALAPGLTLDGQQLELSASFGCVHVAEPQANDLRSVDDLLHLADTRMYAQKRQPAFSG